jgi:hypothetical protein
MNTTPGRLTLQGTVPQMDLRDYFAVHAPPIPIWYMQTVEPDKRMVQWAYRWADLMMAHREK